MGENYLEHHGILGQKWGKHNGPPYPLGSGDHSSAEKSAAKSAGVKVGKSSNGFSYKIHTKAALKTQKDADDLRKHGMHDEANAVQKVADSHKEKAAKALEKNLTKQIRKRKTAKHDLSDRWRWDKSGGENFDKTLSEYKKYQTEKAVEIHNKYGNSDKAFSKYALATGGTVNGKYGKEWINSNINKNMSIAKLLDSGYDRKIAEKYIDELISANRTIAFK